jgi:hypothetical protein
VGHIRRILTERPDKLRGTDMISTVTTEEPQVLVFGAIAECAQSAAARESGRNPGVQSPLMRR